MTYIKIPDNLFWTSVNQFIPNFNTNPFTKKKLDEAIKEIKKIQKSNTLIEFIKNIESVIKKWKITQIKLIQNDLIAEWELIIYYNLKSK